MFRFCFVAQKWSPSRVEIDKIVRFYKSKVYTREYAGGNVNITKMRNLHTDFIPTITDESQRHLGKHPEGFSENKATFCVSSQNTEANKTA